MVLVPSSPDIRALLGSGTYLAPSLSEGEGADHQRMWFGNQNKPAKSTTTSPIKPKPRVAKRDQLIRLLSGRHWASATAINKKLNWQSHTTRAALSKLHKSGIVIEKIASLTGGLCRYHINSIPDVGAKQ